MSASRTTKATAPCRLAALGIANEGALRMAPLLGLPRLLSDHGLDAEAVIRESGCDPTLFNDPDNTIDFTAVGRLLVRTAAVTGLPYPGLDLGRRLGLGVLGPLGGMMRLAPDAGTALRAMILNFHLHDRGAVPSLWESENQTMLGYTLYCPGIAGVDHIYDAALAIAFNLISELAGKGWKPTEIRLFRDPPLDMEPFRQHFQARMRFRAEQAAIVFPTTDLARPLPTSDPNAYAEALRQLEELDASSETHLFSNQVRRLLRRLFINGSGLQAVDLQRTAQLLTLHPRTLNRRLHAEGKNFSALLNETRYQVARQLLRDTALKIEDISIMLGYAGAASFDHAFRRWSGTTATDWRSLEQSSRTG